MQTSKENYDASKRANHLRVFEQIHSHETNNGGASRRAMAAGVTGQTATTVEVASASTGVTLTVKDAYQLRKGMVYMRTVANVRTYFEITGIDGDTVTLDKELAVRTGDSLDFMYRIQERLGYIQVTKNGDGSFTVDPKYEPVLYPGVQVVFYDTINDSGAANQQTSGTLTVDTSTGSTFTVNASPTWTPEYMSFVESSMTKLTDEQLKSMSIFFDIDKDRDRNIDSDFFESVQEVAKYYPHENYSGVARSFFLSHPNIDIRKTMPSTQFQNVRNESTSRLIASLYATAAEDHFDETVIEVESVDGDIEVGTEVLYDPTNTVQTIQGNVITLANPVSILQGEELVFRRTKVKFMTWKKDGNGDPVGKSENPSKITLEIHGGSRWETLMNNRRFQDIDNATYELKWDNQHHNATMGFTLEKRNDDGSFTAVDSSAYPVFTLDVKIQERIDARTLYVTGGRRCQHQEANDP